MRSADDFVMLIGDEQAIHTGIAQRLAEAKGDMSYYELARRLDMVPETVRRQVTTGRCTGLLLHHLVTRLGVDAGWLLTGRAPSAATGDGLEHGDRGEVVQVHNGGE